MRQRQQGTRTRSRTGAPQARPGTGHPQARGHGHGRGHDQGQGYDQGHGHEQGPGHGQGAGQTWGYGPPQGYDQAQGPGWGPEPRPRPSAEVSPWDLPPAVEPDGPKLIWRLLTHTATITGAVLVVLVMAVVYFSPGKGEPPPGAEGLSTNEMLTMMTRSKMSEFEAAAVANAKRKAFEAQQKAERAARAKARRDARLRAKLKAEREARARAAAEAERLAKLANTSVAQNIALGKQMNATKGWSSCWSSLQTMWMRESGWNERADNPSSDAYGIPQALPGSKMATAGPDWQTRAATQIAWGLNYIEARYNTPCQAWTFWQANHWY